MPIEELSQAQITEILTHELGLRVMPKRTLKIPAVTHESLTGKVKPRREGPVLKYVHWLEEFLRMQAIDDKFGTDDFARKAAIGKIMGQFGKAADTVLQPYIKDNQFRVNKLVSVTNSLDRIIDRLYDPQLARYFDELANSTSDCIAGLDTGKQYQNIPDTEGKLHVVHTVEDAALKALQALA